MNILNEHLFSKHVKVNGELHKSQGEKGDKGIIRGVIALRIFINKNVSKGYYFLSKTF